MCSNNNMQYRNSALKFPSVYSRVVRTSGLWTKATIPNIQLSPSLWDASIIQQNRS